MITVAQVQQLVAITGQLNTDKGTLDTAAAAMAAVAAVLATDESVLTADAAKLNALLAQPDISADTAAQVASLVGQMAVDQGNESAALDGVKTAGTALAAAVTAVQTDTSNLQTLVSQINNG